MTPLHFETALIIRCELSDNASGDFPGGNRGMLGRIEDGVDLRILDAMRDPVAVLDTERRIVYANPAMNAFLGLPAGKIVGMPCRDILHGVVGRAGDCPFLRSAATRRRESMETEVPGRGVWVRVCVDPLEDAAGNLCGALHIVTDITDTKRAETRAREDSERLLALMNNIPGVVYRGLPDWSLSFIGAEVRRLTGYPARDFLSGAVSWKQVIHPDDLERFRQTFRQAVSDRRSVLRAEYRILHGNGDIRWVADRRQLIYDGAGRFAYVDGLLLDISERKAAEARLRATMDKFHALVDASPLPIVALDVNGMITLWNGAAERVFGWRSDEVFGMADPAVPEEDREQFRALTERVIREGGFSGVEVRRRRKDGALLDVMLSTASMRDEGGALAGIMSILADITERKRMEEALRDSEERYRRLLDGSPEMIFVVSEGRIVYMNETGIRLLGASSADELAGKPVLDIVHPDSRDVIGDVMRHVGGDGRPTPLMEQKYVRLDGTVVDVEAMGVPIFHHGRPAAQVFARDLTRRNETEAALRRSQEQFRQAQRMEAVGRLAGGVAHDFNNLLTAIRGYADLLLMQLDDGFPLRREVEEIQRAAERAADLTHQLLAFSRKQVLQPKVLNLNAVVSNMDKMIRRLIGEDVDLITVLRPDLGMVKVDPGQIEQVIMNLVVNARDAMPAGGKITIETANVELSGEYASRHTAVHPGPHVMLTVTDTGTGMDDETKQRLFEPFFTTKELGKGTGLGLSTVYGIVKQSSGSIWVYSERGRGTSFKIYFPRHEAAEAGLGGTRRLRSAPRGKETVLLVEDEPVVRLLAAELLRRSGYQVLESGDGAEALRLIEERRCFIDLLLTDIVMPGIGGRQLVEQLPGFLAGMKILYMSGYPDEAIGRHGLLDPGTPFLQKPFTADGLLRKVREILDE